MTRQPRTPVAWQDRFWRHVDKREIGDCWNWTAFKLPRYGYGYIRLTTDSKGPRESAHRASWRIHFGDIPPGIEVCHRCDNPSCVNPGHLFLGTHRDNIDDRIVKGREIRGENRVQAKLTEDDVRSIRRRVADGEDRGALAIEYGIHRMTLNAIARRASWAHVDADGIPTPRRRR